MAEPESAANAPVAELCTICQTEIAACEAAMACPGCATAYHRECWEENRGCGRYGCAHVPEMEKRGELEIPAAYWGNESKACPACGKDIVAAAVRCRHCGTVFKSQAPQTSDDFHSSQAALDQIPRIQGRVWFIFTACAIPGLSLVAGGITALWYLRRRELLARLPALSLGVIQLAMILALVETVILAVVAGIALFRL